MEKFYVNLKYEPPVLKYLIRKKGAIKVNYLKCKKEKKDNCIENI